MCHRKNGVRREMAKVKCSLQVSKVLSKVKETPIKHICGMLLFILQNRFINFLFSLPTCVFIYSESEIKIMFDHWNEILHSMLNISTYSCIVPAMEAYASDMTKQVGVQTAEIKRQKTFIFLPMNNLATRIEFRCFVVFFCCYFLLLNCRCQLSPKASNNKSKLINGLCRWVGNIE